MVIIGYCNHFSFVLVFECIEIRNYFVYYINSKYVSKEKREREREEEPPFIFFVVVVIRFVCNLCINYLEILKKIYSSNEKKR